MQPSRSIEPSSFNRPITVLWEDVSFVEKYDPLPETAIIIFLFDNDTFNITLGFDYNWFGQTITNVTLSSNGQINIDGSTNSNCCSADAIGEYVGARIAFVQHDLYPPEGGEVMYLVKSSPTPLKVSFEDLRFGYEWNCPGAGGTFFER